MSSKVKEFFTIAGLLTVGFLLVLGLHYTVTNEFNNKKLKRAEEVKLTDLKEKGCRQTAVIIFFTDTGHPTIPVPLQKGCRCVIEIEGMEYIPTVTTLDKFCETPAHKNQELAPNDELLRNPPDGEYKRKPQSF